MNWKYALLIKLRSYALGMNYLIEKEITKIDGSKQIYHVLSDDSPHLLNLREHNAHFPFHSVIGMIHPEYGSQLKYEQAAAPGGRLISSATAFLEHTNASQELGFSSEYLFDRHYEKHGHEADWERHAAMLQKANKVLRGNVDQIDDPRLQMALQRNEAGVPNIRSREHAYETMPAAISTHAALVALNLAHGAHGHLDLMDLSHGIHTHIGNSKSTPNLIGAVTKLPAGYLGIQGYNGMPLLGILRVGEHDGDGNMRLTNPHASSSYSLDPDTGGMIRAKPGQMNKLRFGSTIHHD